ncbi:class I SAM-dependent methyltransferase [Litorivicinus sp.]|nr:class I SAM-dependent methyltransferase [Litorivicinus sp.]
MGREVDLLARYPRTNRDITGRLKAKTESDRTVARKFGKEFFDGDRKHGYGGFRYDPKYWQSVVEDIKNFYGLDASSRILDVGCAKGFMLYDFKRIVGCAVKGIDISEYAIENSLEAVRPFLDVADARELPFPDDCFDLVISVNTIHNLDGDCLVKALNEIQRVSKRHTFITVDAYRSEQESEAMFAWNLTAKTILSTDDWKELFGRVGYQGDYFWFIP